MSPRGKTSMSMVGAPAQARSFPRKAKEANAPAPSALLGIGRSSDALDPGRKGNTDPNDTQNHVPKPKIDEGKLRVRDDEASAQKIANDSTAHLQSVNTSATLSSGRISKGKKRAGEDTDALLQTREKTSASTAASPTQGRFPRKAKEAAASTSTPVVPKAVVRGSDAHDPGRRRDTGPAKALNAPRKAREANSATDVDAPAPDTNDTQTAAPKLKIDKGKQRMRDETGSTLIAESASASHAQPLRIALGAGGNSKGRKRAREDEDAGAVPAEKISTATAPAQGRILRNAKEHVASGTDVLVSGHKPGGKSETGHASAPSAKRKANEAVPTTVARLASDSNGNDTPNSILKPDKSKQHMQDNDTSTPSTAGIGSDPKGKKRAREDDGGGAAPPETTAAIAGAPSAREPAKERLPRNAKEHVAPGASHTHAGVRTNSAADIPAREASKARGAPRKANEVASVAADKITPDVNDAQSHVPKLDKGKQRMRAGEAYTPNTAAAGSNPQGRESSREDEDAGAVARAKAISTREMLAKMKFKRIPTVAPDAPVDVALDSDAHDLGINSATGAFRDWRWLWFLKHFMCASVWESTQRPARNARGPSNWPR
ncbi:hypothetical protein HYPSUDRAFT_639359 [Hypholoma sublateritium FD-334 SS-4]|uniref:Uncharacterized protein n=1 Tax=Hypholoma sublateritium (strain FD-334 SS-4) TaxID=945553 RepID=A0A0D2NVG1_HYPSF|nr:hypothetical protein HYPSUDRAFT_639359 [Hypholoma sublateritium FD-334 SS-4]